MENAIEPLGMKDLFSNVPSMDEYKEIRLGLCSQQSKRFGDFITGNDFEWSSKTLYPKSLKGIGIEFGVVADIETPLENFVLQGSEYYHGVKPRLSLTMYKLYIELLPKRKPKIEWYKRLFGVNPAEFSPTEETLLATHHIDMKYSYGNYTREKIERDAPHIVELENSYTDKFKFSVHRRSKRSKDPEYWASESRSYEERNKRLRMAMQKPVNEPSTFDFDPSPCHEWQPLEGVIFDESWFRTVLAQNLPKFRYSRSWLSRQLATVLYDEETSEFSNAMKKSAEVYSFRKDFLSDLFDSIKNPVEFGSAI
jgi:hypothetical protein